MKTTTTMAWLLSTVLAGCASEVSSAPPAPLTGDGDEEEIIEEQTCDETLCVDQQSLDQTADALAACVPSDVIAQGDPAGLRISDVAIVASEGNVLSLRVVLANTYPDGVMTYPGTRLGVVDGAGAVLDGGAGQLYGIFGCDEVDTTYTVEWGGRAPLTLVASAVNDLGDATIHELEVTLQP